MPTCKNDKTRHFKGDEPSPKGRGYCAHAEPVGKRRLGQDRKMWVVKSYKTKAGKTVKRWVCPTKTAPKKKKVGKFQGGMMRAIRAHTIGLKTLPAKVKDQWVAYSRRLRRYKNTLNDHSKELSKEKRDQLIGEINGLKVVLDMLKHKYSNYEFPKV